MIAAIHEESRGTYGWPRVHAELVLGLHYDPLNLSSTLPGIREEAP